MGAMVGLAMTVREAAPLPEDSTEFPTPIEVGEYPCRQYEKWLWFDTGEGFAMLARLNFAAGFGTGARFLYQDDPTLDDGPERFPGQMPNVGFALDRIPFDESFYFMAELDFSEGGPGALAEARRARPAVRWRPATD